MQGHVNSSAAGNRQTERIDARRIAGIAMFSAIAFVVVCLSKMIPINVAGILNPDFKDVVIAMGGFVFGPLAAVFISVFVSALEMITISSTGPVGLIMNVLSTCMLVCPAAVAYRKHRTQRSAVIGLAVGIILMTAAMMLWNYLITPLYMGVAREVVAGMLIPVFLPFNLLKGGINSALTVLLYKPVVTALRRARILPESQSGTARKTRWGVILIALTVLTACTMLILVMAGVI